MKIFNSLTRQVEEFKPLSPPSVGMYACGPTVYDYAQIGNFRTYTLSDLLIRVLRMNGYQIKFIMNITDVGHLTGDNAGDADTGEDRLQKAAAKEGKTAWDIAKFYTDVFITDMEKLNITKPEIFTKATEYIPEQIELVKQLEAKGLTYKINDGIYFDTIAFEKQTGKKYGELSNLDQIKEGARVEANPEKKNARDFALWKFSAKPGERHMEWASPWGIGFPGWHIECSAMSMKYLGETFDLHVGGEDIKMHHTNEIAQSEGATGKKFVNYWVHGAFLKIDGGRMGKSLGNAYTVSDIEHRGFEPLALRYFYLTGKYRDALNFTWQGLESAQKSLNNLREHVLALKKQEGKRSTLSSEKEKQTEEYRQQFEDAFNNDLNAPQALAVVWSMLKSNIPSEDKYDLLMSFDEVLGFNLADVQAQEITIPNDVAILLQEREHLRKAGKYDQSDLVRQKIFDLGYTIKDTPEGVQVLPNETKQAD